MQEHFQIIVKQIAAGRHKQAAPYVLLASILAAMALVAGCGGGGGGGGSSAPPVPTIIVSGTVTDNFLHAGAANVTVTIQGQAHPTTVTDANGDYSLSGVPENSNVTLLFENLQTCESETFQVTTTAVSPQTGVDPPDLPFSLTNPNGCAIN